MANGGGGWGRWGWETRSLDIAGTQTCCITGNDPAEPHLMPKEARKVNNNKLQGKTDITMATNIVLETTMVRPLPPFTSDSTTSPEKF